MRAILSTTTIAILTLNHPDSPTTMQAMASVSKFLRSTIADFWIANVASSGFVLSLEMFGIYLNSKRVSCRSLKKTSESALPIRDQCREQDLQSGQMSLQVLLTQSRSPLSLSKKYYGAPLLRECFARHLRVSILL